MKGHGEWESSSVSTGKGMTFYHEGESTLGTDLGGGRGADTEQVYRKNKRVGVDWAGNGKGGGEV